MSIKLPPSKLKLKLQWGLIPKTAQNNPTITLPIALREKCFFAAGQYIDYEWASESEWGYFYERTLTDFKIVYSRGADMAWLLIGM